MENKVKGTKQDVGNNNRYRRYCSDDRQYYRHGDQYREDRKET